jgi:hypothetical protein
MLPLVRVLDEKLSWYTDDAGVGNNFDSIRPKSKVVVDDYSVKYRRRVYNYTGTVPLEAFSTKY